MNLLYKFSKGFLIGYGLIAAFAMLPLAGTLAQALFGFCIGIVGWVWVKQKTN